MAFNVVLEQIKMVAKCDDTEAQRLRDVIEEWFDSDFSEMTDREIIATIRDAMAWS